MQKNIFILIFLVSLFTLFSCRGTPAVSDSDYTTTLIQLQRRIDGLKARNQELETRLSELIENNRRYADYYRFATATVKSSLDLADGTAGSLEERIDRLLRINDKLTELIQQISDGEREITSGKQVSGQNH